MVASCSRSPLVSKIISVTDIAPCACPRENGPKDWRIQERAANVLRALTAPQSTTGLDVHGSPKSAAIHENVAIAADAAPQPQHGDPFYLPPVCTNRAAPKWGPRGGTGQPLASIAPSSGESNPQHGGMGEVTDAELIILGNQRAMMGALHCNSCARVFLAQALAFLSRAAFCTHFRDPESIDRCPPCRASPDHRESGNSLLPPVADLAD